MRIRAVTALVISVAICASGILTTKAAGMWTTESTKIPARFENMDEFNGQYRADDIRGSYTFGEISSLYGVPLAHLAEAFNVAENEAQGFQCKSLEAIFADSEFEIGTGSVRLFVAFYLGQPYTLTENTYITADGARIIEAYGNPTAEQIEYLASHVTATQSGSSWKDSAAQPNSTAQNSKVSAAAEYPVLDVKGSSYLKDLAKTYDIPINDFAEAFLLSKLEAENFQVKDIKEKFSGTDAEIGTGSIKIFISFYRGIPYDLAGTEAMLTAKGAEIIKTKGTPSEDQLKYLDAHTLELS